MDTSQSYTQAGAREGAVLQYCSAATALFDAKEGGKTQKKTLREGVKESKAQLLALLAAAPPNVCVEVPLAEGGTGFAAKVQKKGAAKQLTPPNLVAALRALTLDDVRTDPTPRGITAAAMERLRSEAREDVKITKTAPPKLSVSRSPQAATVGATFQRQQHELKELGAREREVCAPHKQRCDAVTTQVISHLQAHDPQKWKQSIRINQGEKERAFVLKATKKPVRIGRADAMQMAARAIESCVGRWTAEPRALLGALTHEATLDRIAAALKAAFEAAKTEAEKSAKISVDMKAA